MTVHVLTGPSLDALGCVDSEPPKQKPLHKKLGKKQHRQKGKASKKNSMERTEGNVQDEELMQAQQPYDENDVPFRRGDIEIIHTDNCDGKLNLYLHYIPNSGCFARIGYQTLPSLEPGRHVGEWVLQWKVLQALKKYCC